MSGIPAEFANAHGGSTSVCGACSSPCVAAAACALLTTPPVWRCRFRPRTFQAGAYAGSRQWYGTDGSADGRTRTARAASAAAGGTANDANGSAHGHDATHGVPWHAAWFSANVRRGCPRVVLRVVQRVRCLRRVESTRLVYRVCATASDWQRCLCVAPCVLLQCVRRVGGMPPGMPPMGVPPHGMPPMGMPPAGLPPGWPPAGLPPGAASAGVAAPGVSAAASASAPPGAVAVAAAGAGAAPTAAPVAAPAAAPTLSVGPNTKLVHPPSEALSLEELRAALPKYKFDEAKAAAAAADAAKAVASRVGN